MATHLATPADAFEYLNRVVRITNAIKGHAPRLNNTVLSLWTVINKYADLGNLFAYTSANCTERFGRALWFTSKKSGQDYYVGYNSHTGKIDVRKNMHAGSTMLSLTDDNLDEPGLKKFFAAL
jgi:hypothetical protein